MPVTVFLAPLPKPPLNLHPPLSENDPETYREEFDNQPNLIFTPLPDEEIGDPMKTRSLQPRHARAWQG